MHQYLILAALVVASATLAVADEPAPEDHVDFLRDIRPILAQNCFMCHGPDEATRESSLRLDSRQGATAEADSGLPAIVPGDSAASELLVRLEAEDEYLRMPPPESGRELTAEQIQKVRRWIDQGAPYAEHWAFQPPVPRPIPEVENRSWPRNEIDYFVLARLEAEQFTPAPEADRTTLIRRLSLDLRGLPPTTGEIDRFLADDSPDAYETLVDRMLQSPHFGERWGRHWLDVARYADSDGYLGDDLRPYAWKYRDWVIQAFNRDLPFDDFTIEQLAGDLLPNPTLEQRIATGFHRNSMKNTEAGADRELDRVIRTVDRTSTTAAAWLGLTLGCAECHTHKFDPITHTEFYQMYAFFNNVEDRDIPAAPPEDQAAYERERAEWQQDVNAVKKSIRKLISQLNAKRDDAEFAQEEILKTLRTSESKRSESELADLATFFAELDDAQRKLFARYEKLAATKPEPPKEKAPTIAEASKQRETFVHLRGDFRSPGEQVQPGTLKVLHPLEPQSTSADRLDLARWIVDEANPLTPRTAVNRVWQHLFGQGLVTTPDDFGTTGDAPSHPELLDWLAAGFRDSGWSRKRLIRQIVTSATYRQSSRGRPELAEIDPHNRLLARQSRFRLEAEVVRDVALAAGGLMAAQIGGPSVRPLMNTQITEISRNKDWKVSEGADRYRRGMYILFRRGTPYPMLTTFDAPDSTVACTRRERSNSPLQSLTLLNDPVFFECAQYLGRRIAREAGSSPEEWIAHGYRLCLGRAPKPAEQARASEFLAQQRQLLAELDDDQLEQFVGLPPLPDKELEQQAECVALARVLTNLDEFITRE